jgi:hypothetical protein
MGGKPRKKPLTYGDLISGFDRIGIGTNEKTQTGEFWEVTRRLMPNHPVKEFGMAIQSWGEKRILRGVNKGGTRVTIVIDYKEKNPT